MKIAFMGTPAAARASLEALAAAGHEIAAVYTQPDRPSGRGNRIILSPVKEWALEHGVAVFQPTTLRTTEAADEFRSFGADVAVVVAYGRILPDAFLSAFRFGAVNVHFSLLPKYRGAAPVNWAIVNGETETGVTIMRMDSGLDTGPILSREVVTIGAEETAGGLTERLAVIGAELLVKTISSIDSIVPEPQGNEGACYAPILRRSDGLIDWSMAAAAVNDRIRGFQPFPSAFTYFGDTQIKIWRAEVSDRIVDGPPGTISEADGDGLCVACGECTELRIREVQPEGKRRMSVRDMLNGLHIAVGMRFGQ